MSGGVDSSVAACLLLEQGYEVVGSHMRLVHLDGVEHGCCGPAARNDAAEVARIAGFPFEICDLSDEFERTVIGDFVAEHEAGRTPNPCARCNGEIKFGAFLRRADELGIDAVATGHYVRTDRRGGRLRLLRGADRAKDQSYMLHMLGQGELSRSLLPGRRDAEGRHARGRRALRAAGREQARFAGAVLRAERRGGRVPGLGRAAPDARGRGRRHGRTRAGAARGFGGVHGRAAAWPRRLGPRALLRARDRPGGQPGDRRAGGAAGAFGRDRRSRLVGGRRAAVRGARSRPRFGSGTGATTSRPWSSRSGTTVRIEFRTPQRGVAPGQSAVVYRGDELLGGGRIVDVLR